jgi:thioredoxin reductase (NADPH)
VAANEYDVIVVGGGPAGLTTALYTTRLGHDTAVINRGGGRAAMMMDTHNVIGVPESVSGKEFLETAVEQLEEYGTEYFRDFVTAIEEVDAGDLRFRLETSNEEWFANRVVLATGFSDKRPDPPLPRTGRGLHYCLHCDAYMFIDEPVYVMGHGESAAQVAMIMLNFSDEVDLLLDGDEPTWSDETDRQVRGHPLDIIEAEITGIENGDDGWLEDLEFADGTRRPYHGGFAMYGSEYNNDLALDLGCEINDDGTIAVDDHGRTTVDGVYAVGDLTPGHNQIPVAMGEGAKAGISINFDLRRFPRSLEELESGESIAAPAVSSKLRDHARQRRAGVESD